MKDHTKNMHWVFDDNDDDVRGWPVLDLNNAKVGTVDEVLVDTATSYVSAIQLSDGKRIEAENVRLGDHELFVTTADRRRLSAAELELAKAASLPAVAKPVAMPRPSAMTRPIETVSAIPPARPVEAAKPIDSPAIAARTDMASIGDDVLLELVGEELQVGKRVYSAGGVHLETHIVSEPIAREVHLKEEHLSVARNKVDRALDGADAERFFHEQTFEVVTKAEEPIVRKQSHVVEEVVIKKAEFVHNETVRDTVRRVEASVTELREAEAHQGGVR